MKCQSAQVLLVSTAVLQLVSSATFTIRFERDTEDENDIVLTCSEGGIGVDDAVFRRDGESIFLGSNYEFTITQDTEGNYTCHRQGQPAMPSERLELAALPRPYEGVTPKTLYVRRGDVAEIPCDFYRGKARALYSVSWVRNKFTTVSVDSPPYQGIDANNYSLFVMTNKTTATDDGTTHLCSVSVTGCGGDCIQPSPRIESGAVVKIMNIDAPIVDIMTDNLDVTTGQEAEITCTAVGDHIEEIEWTVNGTLCNQDTRCALQLSNSEDEKKTSIITLSTDDQLGGTVVQCVAIQKLSSEKRDIIDPSNPQELRSEVEFRQTAEPVTVTILPTPPAEPSTSPIAPSKATTASSSVVPSLGTTTPRSSSGSGDNSTIYIIAIVAVVVVIVLVVAIVTCGAVICCCGKRYNHHKFPSDGPLPSSGSTPTHGRYRDYTDSQSHLYEDVFSPLGRDDDDGRTIPSDCFKSPYDRQNGIPFDYEFSDKGSLALFPFQNEERLSQCFQEPLYNASLASGASSSSGYELLPDYHYQRLSRSPQASPYYRGASRSPQASPNYRGASRSPQASPHYWQASRSPHASPHRRTSRSPHASPHYRRRSGSRSPKPPHHARQSRSRSPRLDETVYRPNERTSRSRSPHFPSRPRSHSPLYYFMYPLPEAKLPPEPPSPAYQRDLPQEDAPDADRISDKTLLSVLTCLMHPGDCQVPRCPCKALQQKCNELQATLQSNDSEPAYDTHSEFPQDRRQQMKLSLSVANIPRNVNPHFHLTRRPSIKPVTQRPFFRQRSKSFDLTPITEQMEFPSPVTPLAAHNKGTPDSAGFGYNASTPCDARPCFLREISISADNLPALCVNDCPITPSPLREYRSLANAGMSPNREDRGRWVARPQMESVPEGRLSIESTTSNESNTSSRTPEATTHSDGDASDIEAPADMVRATPPAVVPKGVLRRNITSQESGYESPGYVSEGSQPNSTKLRRKQLKKQHEMLNLEHGGGRVVVNETLC